MEKPAPTPDTSSVTRRTFSLSSLRQKALSGLRIAHFIISSHNEVVAYHRTVCFAAILPLLYSACISAAYFLYYIHTLFLRQVVHFVLLTAISYSVYIIQAKLLPRRKTFDAWKSYMCTAKHSHHVHAIFFAFNEQLTHGDAPDDENDVPGSVPTEVYHLWKTKHHGLSPDQVRTKYVNFCWRYVYRLWFNQVNLKQLKEAPALDPPEGLLPQKDSLDGVDYKELERHGDSAKRLPSSVEYLKLHTLGDLAHRVSDMSRLFKGDSSSNSSTDESPHATRIEDNPIYKKLNSHIRKREDMLS